MKKLNLSIIAYAGISYGGAHRQVIRLACALDKKKINVRFFWCKHKKDIGSTFIFPELDYNNLDILRAHGVDVVEFNVEARDIRRRFHPWLNTNFWEIFRKYETDLVFTAKAGYPEYPFILMKHPVVEWNVFSSLDVTGNLVMSVSQSDWVQNAWLNIGGDSTKNTLIYPFVPEPQTQDGLRKYLGISVSDVVIGFHQREDDHIYGEQALIAYSLLDMKIRKKTKFLILGGSEKYVHLANKLGVCLIKLPIEKDYEKVSKFLNSLDIYTHSGGSGETLCIAIQEAMMHGLPVITMDIKGRPNAQISTLRNSGIIVNNVNEYAERLNFIIQNNNQRLIIGAESKKIALQEYSEESCVSKFTQLFFKLHNRDAKERFRLTGVFLIFLVEGLKFFLNDLRRQFIRNLNK
jgi:glycosyltransferase involved in cell wall biosynthesis